MIHPKDQMTSKERMLAYFKGKEVDRLPFSVYLGEPAAKFINTSSYEHYHNPDKMVEVEVFCYKRFGADGVNIRTGLHGFAEAMGSKLNFPQYGLASVEKAFLAQEENSNDLEPADPHKDGRLPMFLEALEKLQKELGEFVGVSAAIPGPFTTLSSLRGPENLMKDLYASPELVEDWLNIICKTIFAYIDEAVKLDVGFSMSEPMASSTLISPRMFVKFVKPYLKQCSEHIFEQTGKKPSLHICGQTEKVLEDMVEVGISSLSLDNVVDMELAKKRVGDQVCLVGNVKPVDTILNGKKEDIYNEVSDLFKKLHDNAKGYMMAPGCQLPMPISIERVELYADIVRQICKFPIKRQGEVRL